MIGKVAVAIDAKKEEDPGIVIGLDPVPQPLPE